MGPSWAVSGASWAVLGRSRAALGFSGRPLGQCWGGIRDLGNARIFQTTKANQGVVPLQVLLGGIFEASRDIFGAS
eukprot:2895590-Pyramimonas_sp.AAC.1